MNPFWSFKENYDLKATCENYTLLNIQNFMMQQIFNPVKWQTGSGYDWLHHGSGLL